MYEQEVAHRICLGILLFMPPNRDPYKTLRSAIPYSRMVFPQPFFHKLKYIFWRAYTPFHPFFRDTALALHIVSAKVKAERWGARQNFLLGHIAPQETFESVSTYLVNKGFGNHFVAWEDDGEVVSLRYAPNFATQYHIRIFTDGEVRAHFEYTPECYPLKHYHAVGFEPRREYFLELLGDKIIPSNAS